MLKKILNKIKNDELMRGSLILLVTVNIYNILNYGFHFSMARLLGPSDYGVLVILVSIISIIAIPSEAIQNVITTYSNRFDVGRETGKIKFMLFKGLKKGSLISLILFILYIPFALFFSYFLKIDFWLFIITGILIFFSLNFPILRGILQGQKKFTLLGINMIMESLIKLLIAIIFVLLGFKVYGSIFGVVVGLSLSFIITFLFIKDVLDSESKEDNFKGIYSYSFPYFIALISIVLISSLDIILEKRFFSPELAGKYSVASTLGKMIFFGVIAISKVIVPMSSEKSNKGEKTGYLLKRAMIISTLISGIILFFYYFIPELIIKILFGNQYIDVANIVFILGFGMFFLSLANLIILYGLSINEIKGSSFSLIIFIIMEILFFYLFHKTLIEYSISFMIINFLIFLYSLLLIRKWK